MCRRPRRRRWRHWRMRRGSDDSSTGLHRLGSRWSRMADGDVLRRAAAAAAAACLRCCHGSGWWRGRRSGQPCGARRRRCRCGGGRWDGGGALLLSNHRLIALSGRSGVADDSGRESSSEKLGLWWRSWANWWVWQLAPEVDLFFLFSFFGRVDRLLSSCRRCLDGLRGLESFLCPLGHCCRAQVHAASALPPTAARLVLLPQEVVNIEVFLVLFGWHVDCVA
jgi:hypothetical protein